MRDYILIFVIGTGKTTTARKMGQVYYDMGFLSSAEVVECSASDLVGEYVGQTGPKTRNLFEKAIGKVLFVDEAYRLSQGHFAQEAIDEVVGLMTNEKFKGIQLSVEEWRVVSFINPKNSIRQIAKACNMTDMEIRRIVYGLMHAGLVELVKAQTAEGPKKPVNRPKPGVTPPQRPVINKLIDRIKNL